MKKPIRDLVEYEETYERFGNTRRKYQESFLYEENSKKFGMKKPIRDLVWRNILEIWQSMKKGMKKPTRDLFNNEDTYQRFNGIVWRNL